MGRILIHYSMKRIRIQIKKIRHTAYKALYTALETNPYLLLEVDVCGLLLEADGVHRVGAGLGVEVELQDPHGSVGSSDGVVLGVLHHDLDRPVSEHVHLHISDRVRSNPLLKVEKKEKNLKIMLKKILNQKKKERKAGMRKEGREAGRKGRKDRKKGKKGRMERKG